MNLLKNGGLNLLKKVISKFIAIVILQASVMLKEITLNMKFLIVKSTHTDHGKQ